jgi:hypothetical protein
MVRSSGVVRKPVLVGVHVRVASDDTSFAALASEISLAGVFLRTYRSLQSGSSVTVVIDAPGGPITAEGTVVGARACGGGIGLEVHFEKISLAGRDRLAALSALGLLGAG